MASALKFIGGGLLSGLGKGLAEQGKVKREAVLKRLEEERAQKRRLELLDAGNAAASERLGQNIASRESIAKATTESRETLASEATTSREGIASRATESREGIATAANVSREKIAGGKFTKTDTSAAEKRAFDSLVKIHTEFDVDRGDVTDWSAVAAGLDEKGFGKLAKAARSRGKAIVEADDLKRATSQADAELEEKTGFFFDDLNEDGGSPTRFHARRVRELLKEFADARSGKVTPGSGDSIDITSPTAVGDNPYVGAAPPPAAPNAKQADDGFWYLPPLQSGGKFRRVQKTEANSVSGSRSPRDR